MARTTSEVVRFDLRSRATGKRLRLIQRTAFRLDVVDRHCVRTPLYTSMMGDDGQAFEKVPGGVRCIDSGEVFVVLGVSAKPVRTASTAQFGSST